MGQKTFVNNTAVSIGHKHPVTRVVCGRSTVTDNVHDIRTRKLRAPLEN